MQLAQDYPFTRKALYPSSTFHKGEMRLSFVPFSLHPKPPTGTAVMSSSLILPVPLALGLPSTTHLPFGSRPSNRTPTFGTVGCQRDGKGLHSASSELPITWEVCPFSEPQLPHLEKRGLNLLSATLWLQQSFSQVHCPRYHSLRFYLTGLG